MVKKNHYEEEVDGADHTSKTGDFQSWNEVWFSMDEGRKLSEADVLERIREKAGSGSPQNV